MKGTRRSEFKCDVQGQMITWRILKRRRTTQSKQEKGLSYHRSSVRSLCPRWQTLLKPEVQGSDDILLWVTVTCLPPLSGPDLPPSLEFTESFNRPPCHGGCYFFHLFLLLLFRLAFPEHGQRCRMMRSLYLQQENGGNGCVLFLLSLCCAILKSPLFK